MRFRYKIIHVPGKELFTADTLSRAPVTETTEDPLTDEVEAFVNVVMQGMPATDQRMEQLKKRQLEDEVCREVTKHVKAGWPLKENLKGIAQQYWQNQAELTIVNGLLMYGSRVVIPSALRQDILEKLHEGHQGITKCRGRTIESLWWPGVNKNIKELIDNYKVCCQTSRVHPEPLIPSEMPQRPWHKIAVDLMEFKKTQYLVMVDYYSRYIELAKLEHTTSEAVINHMKSFLARHGIPETIISDNGPQIASKEFALFAVDYGFSHVTSSPGHASANGEAERAVRTIKELLHAAKDPYIALLNYRSTPLADGYSPAELLMSRKLRTKLPVVAENLQASIPNKQDLRKKVEVAKLNMRLNFDSHHTTKPLPVLQKGKKVWVPDRRESGQVQDQISNHSRSYLVNTPSGTFRRNRVHLRKLPVADLLSPKEQQNKVELSPTIN